MCCDCVCACFVCDMYVHSVCYLDICLCCSVFVLEGGGVLFGARLFSSCVMCSLLCLCVCYCCCS